MVFTNRAALTGTDDDVQPIQVLKVAQFVPSHYQVAIFDFVKDGNGHGVVKALAGSGKTTTIVRALEFTPKDSDVAFCAFNKHIASELQSRAPSHVHVSTLHSLGYANIRAQFGNVQVDDKKAQQIFDEAYEYNWDMRAIRPAILRLVGLCKGTMSRPDTDSVELLQDRYSIETNGMSHSIVVSAVDRVFHESIEQTSVIDYEDMIYFCASGIVPCKQFDYLFVDEAQDLNKAQIAMVLRSTRGRAVCVGDEHQSIYGFRGADIEAMPNIIDGLGAVTMPLSVSYRCPLRVVELARSIVPELEAREGAPDGTIENISNEQFLSRVAQNDMVLCRTNAPLVEPCFALIRRGIKATIRGRDIGIGLLNLMSRVSKKSRETSLHGFLFALNQYSYSECGKLVAAGKTERASSIRDQVETILAVADGCDTVQQIRDRIASIFSDDKAAVTLSSVHRAKGLESDRVFVLRPDLMPHRMATQPWQIVQERNLMYVCYTRSKSELYFVSG